MESKGNGLLVRTALLALMVVLSGPQAGAAEGPEAKTVNEVEIAPATGVRRVVASGELSEAERLPLGGMRDAGARGGGTRSVTTSGGGSSLVRVVVSLGAVVAVIFGVRWAGRRFFGLQATGNTGGAVRVLSRMMVSPRQQLMVLQVGQRVVVVANSGGQMNTISEITDPDEVAALIGQIRGKGGADGVFPAMMGAEGKQYDAAEADDAEPVEREAEDVVKTRRELGGLLARVKSLSKQFRAPLVAVALMVGAAGPVMAQEGAEPPTAPSAPTRGTAGSEAGEGAPAGGTGLPKEADPFRTMNLPDLSKRENFSAAMQIVVLLTVLSLAPAIMIMMTSFTRIVIVLSLLRQALGTAQLPPNQVLIGLSMFMTFLVMGPTLSKVNSEALAPYMEGKISQKDALVLAQGPVREFMIRQIEAAGNREDVLLFTDFAKQPTPQSYSEVGTMTLIPAFMLSELKTAFLLGFKIYLPFLVIDMVISAVLISMGMMMLPPVLISLPFKLLLFVLVDGWRLITGSLMGSFV